MDIVTAIPPEFDRWPILALTFAEACRLLSLEATTWRDLLDGLVDDGVLMRRADGTYVSRSIDVASLALNCAELAMTRLIASAATGLSSGGRSRPKCAARVAPGGVVVTMRFTAEDSAQPRRQ